MIVTTPLQDTPEIHPTIYNYFILGAQDGRARLGYFRVCALGVFGGFHGGRGFHVERLEIMQDLILALQLATQNALAGMPSLLGFSRTHEFMGSDEEFKIVNSLITACRDYHAAKYKSEYDFAMQLLDHATAINDEGDWIRQHDYYSQAGAKDQNLFGQFDSLCGASKMYGPQGLADKFKHLHAEHEIAIGGW